MDDIKNNGKIFTEEDFDKPSQGKNWFRKHTKSLIGASAIIICITVSSIFTLRNCTGNKAVAVDSLKTDTLRNDSISKSVDVVDTALADTISGKVQTQAITDTIHSRELKSNDKELTINSVSADEIKTTALSVIRGRYGNNPKRRRLLKEKYQEIQNKVNELYSRRQVK